MSATDYTGATVLMAAECVGMAQSFPGACPWCSSPVRARFHSGACPRVAVIEYYPNGTVKRAEFRANVPEDGES